jgi:hypothetical protein
VINNIACNELASGCVRGFAGRSNHHACQWEAALGRRRDAGERPINETAQPLPRLKASRRRGSVRRSSWCWKLGQTHAWGDSLSTSIRMTDLVCLRAQRMTKAARSIRQATMVTAKGGISVHRAGQFLLRGVRRLSPLSMEPISPSDASSRGQPRQHCVQLDLAWCLCCASCKQSSSSVLPSYGN